MVETPGAPVAENVQHVLAVSCTALTPCGFHRASAALSPVQAMYVAEGHFFKNIPAVGVLHTSFNL